MEQRILAFLLIFLTAACGQPESTVRAPLAIEVTSDLAYTDPVQDFLSGQELDVYAPAQGEGLPVLVFLHGGGGSKNDPEIIRFSELIAEQGVVVFTPSVPIGAPEDLAILKGRKMREAMESVVCAVRFSRAHANDFGGNPVRISLVGHSGGGLLGLLVSLMGDDLARYWDPLPGGPAQQSECLESQGASGEVQAFVGLNGAYFIFSPESPYHTPKIWPLANPYEYVGNNPELQMRFIVGGQDDTQPDWHKDQ
ncbi:MAG TPA: carboxylesterase family protein, partial [Acidimicrobiia bacterium]|nr:carboxylesterase family protein [Acidimicrobiia bacterium]